MTTMNEAPVDDTQDWHASTTQIRDVVKWIATAFAALGAALLGTTPLSPLASADVSSGQRLLLCGLAAIALLSVGFIVWRCTSMLAPQTTTVPRVIDDAEYLTLRQAIEDDPGAFLGAWSTSLADFVRLRDEEYEVLNGLDAALGTCEPSQSQALTAARDKVVARVEAMGRVSRRLLAVASYYRMRRDLDHDRPLLFGAAGVAAIAIASFVVVGATGATEDAEKNIEPTAAVVLFTGNTAGDNQRIVGRRCPILFDAVVSRTGDGPWEISPATPGCRRGRLNVGADEVTVLLTPTAP